MIALTVARLQRERHASTLGAADDWCSLAEVLASLDRAANALSTARYVTADLAKAAKNAATMTGRQLGKSPRPAEPVKPSRHR